MKKNLFISTLIFGILVSPLVANAAYPILEGILGGIQGAMALIAGAVVVIMFLWAAIEFATAAGNPEQISKAKKAFFYCVIAALVGIVAYSMIALIREITGL